MARGQLPLTTFAEKNGVLGRACEAAGRDPGSLRHSFELLGLVGPSPAFVTEAQRRIDEMFADQTPQQQFAVEPLFEPGTDAVVDFIGRLADQGVDEVQLQLLFVETDEVLDYIGREILPQVAGL